MNGLASMILAATLLLGVAAAQAGEWVLMPDDGNGVRGIEYHSELFYPGEGAVLRATRLYDLETEDGVPVAGKLIDLAIALTTDPDKPITGFDGVWLGNASETGDTFDLFRNTEPGWAGPWGACVSWDLFEGPLGDFRAKQSCEYTCFDSMEDLGYQRNPVPCSAGTAHHMLVSVIGIIKGKVMSEDAHVAAYSTSSTRSRIRAATHLFVGVKNGTKTSINYRINDVFRDLMWERWD